MPNAAIDPNAVALSYELARRVRGVARSNYALATSCIETSYLLERAAAQFGLRMRRVVAQVHAYSPRMADAIRDGLSLDELRQLAEQPGYWSVSIGVPRPGEWMGKSDVAANRFIGHVVCLTAETPTMRLLVDPSADQMNRPQYGLCVVDILSGLKAEDSCFLRSQVPALRVLAGCSHVAPFGA